jgi:hypothetical protein
MKPMRLNQLVDLEVGNVNTDSKDIREFISRHAQSEVNFRIVNSKWKRGTPEEIGQAPKDTPRSSSRLKRFDETAMYLRPEPDPEERQVSNTPLIEPMGEEWGGWGLGGEQLRQGRFRSERGAGRKPTTRRADAKHPAQAWGSSTFAACFFIGARCGRSWCRHRGRRGRNRTVGLLVALVQKWIISTISDVH